MAIVRLDKVAGHHLESIQSTEVLKNGYFVELGDLTEGGLRKVAKPTDVAKGVIVLHASPEVDPDPRKIGLKHFEVAIGEAGRAYHLVKGDIITLTKDAFTSTPSVKDIVAPHAGVYTLETTSAETASLQLQVIQKTTLGYENTEAYVVQVIKA